MQIILDFPAAEPEEEVNPWCNKECEETDDKTNAYGSVDHK